MSFELRLILGALSVYRISELLSLDDGPFEIFKNLRESLGRKSHSSLLFKELALLLSCPFCTGVWVSIFVLVLILLPSGIGDIFLIILALSGAQTFLEQCSFKR